MTAISRKDEMQMRALILNDRFVQAWNNGDIAAACKEYIEDATFVGRGNIIKGRDNIIDYYKKSYPTKAEMGTLSLSFVEFRCYYELAAPMMASAVLKFEVSGEGFYHQGHSLEVYAMFRGSLYIIQDVSIGTSLRR